MFTGLVEEMGSVVDKTEKKGAVVFSVRGRKTTRTLRKGDSIAVEGVCLTVVRRIRSVISVEVVEETLGKTTLGGIECGDKVNLETPMKLGSVFGGHVVLGHVDCTGIIRGVTKRSGSWVFTIQFPEQFKKYVIPVGSIAVNGVSLTVAQRKNSAIAVSIIPHTWSVTTFQFLRKGDRVNLEFDVLGKYVLNMPGSRGRS